MESAQMTEGMYVARVDELFWFSLPRRKDEDSGSFCQRRMNIKNNKQQLKRLENSKTEETNFYFEER